MIELGGTPNSNKKEEIRTKFRERRLIYKFYQMMSIIDAREKQRVTKIKKRSITSI